MLAAADTSAALDTGLPKDDTRAVCNPDAALTSESGSNAASSAAVRSCTAPSTADAEGGSTGAETQGGADFDFIRTVPVHGCN